MAELERLTAGNDSLAVLPDVLQALETSGGVIVEDLLGVDAARRIQDDFAPGYDAVAAGSRSEQPQWQVFHGGNTIRFTGLAARSDAFVEHALLNPMLLAVADALLLPHAADYWLNTGQVMAVGPGEVAQVVHRDEGNWPEALADERELTVSCMFALSDFTAENGATVVQPGSHRTTVGGWRDTDRAKTEATTTQAVMPAGSGMIYTGKVVHGAGANASDAWRFGLHVSFVVGWLRPEEASPLMVDRKRAAELPQRARELLGWSSYHSNGGGRTWLVDFEDASRLFNRTDEPSDQSVSSASN